MCQSEAHAGITGEPIQFQSVATAVLIQNVEQQSRRSVAGRLDQKYADSCV